MEDIYHGRTELGIGQHDLIKKRLEEERQQDYKDHIARKARGETLLAAGDSPPTVTRSSSVVDIGYETSQHIAQQRKHLNDARRAEYAAHLAARSSGVQTDRQDESNTSTQTTRATSQDEGTNTLDLTMIEQSEDERKQKQRSYAEALREQIEEKRINSERKKKKEKEEDKKNIELAKGSNKCFNYGSYSHNNNYH